MFEDCTWKYEIGGQDVIIALSTKVAELQATLETQDKRVVALATQAKKEPASDIATSSTGEPDGAHRSKRDPWSQQLGT